jgi:hypothetical protein
MYDIKATVTKASETDVKLAGDWPTDCLQAPGSIGSMEILRKLIPVSYSKLLEGKLNIWKSIM